MNVYEASALLSQRLLLKSVESLGQLLILSQAWSGATANRYQCSIISADSRPFKYHSQISSGSRFQLFYWNNSPQSYFVCVHFIVVEYTSLSLSPMLLDTLICQIKVLKLTKYSTYFYRKIHIQYVLKRVSLGSKDCTKELKLECAYFLGQTS